MLLILEILNYNHILFCKCNSYITVLILFWKSNLCRIARCYFPLKIIYEALVIPPYRTKNKF